MPLIDNVRRPAVGAKPGGRYAGGLIPIRRGDELVAANPFAEPDDGSPSLAQSIAASNAVLAAKGGDRFAHLGANPLVAAAVPDPRMTGRVSTIGAEGYNQMLKNMQNGTFGNQPQAKPGAPGNPLVAGVTPASPAQPNGLTISNGMDSGSGLQITNGFDSPAPAAPAPQAAAPATPQQPTQQQPQKFARGRVPNALINGIVRGEGGPTEDKVPAKVSPDEAILPAKTVQALGGPAAIKALIERTNDGQPPESEVKGGGRYADGAVPGFVADWQDAMERGAPIRQDVENLTQLGADTVAYARRPADAFMDKVARSGNQIAGASRQAIGDFSGVSRRMPDIPAEDAAAYAAQPSPRPLVANVARPPETPTTTPAVTSLAAAARRPSAPLQSGSPLIAAAPYRNTPDAPPFSGGAMSSSVDVPAREQAGPKVGIIADPAAQERRAFDNFVTRSNGEAAYRDAIRSGKPQNIQAASNALANLTKIGDEQEAAAGAFQQGLEGLRQKSAAERDAEDNKGRWSLAQYAQQGRNAMAAETVRGNNALVTEAMRGRNNLDVADLRAKSEQAGREYINPLDAQIKQAQVADSNVRAALRDQVLKGSPAEQQAAAKQLAALDGKFQDRDSAEVAKARMALVGDIAKAYNGPMGVPLGPDKMPIPFDQYAAPVLRAAGAGDMQSQQQAPSFEQYSSQIRARNPGQQLTDKQLQDAYGERYGASASQAPGTVSTGQVINGYRFKGGDPSKQASWEKVGDAERPSIIRSGFVSSVPLVGPSLGLAQWVGRHFSR
ncbi:MAG: hypothetical protein J0L85_07395 [Zoogloea sp.]|nr:hypothetical protein [Zoogloea sp.]MCA0187489.1 hypothetical protein [Pseudomonadota bacterium]